jgi:hypothetical protein
MNTSQTLLVFFLVIVLSINIHFIVYTLLPQTNPHQASPLLTSIANFAISQAINQLYLYIAGPVRFNFVFICHFLLSVIPGLTASMLYEPFVTARNRVICL